MSGQTILHSARVGWLTLVRNGALVGTAAFAVVFGWDRRGASGLAWLSGLSPRTTAWGIATLTFTAAVALGAFLGYQALKQQGRLLLRIETDGRLQSQPSRGRSRHIGQRAGA